MAYSLDCMLLELSDMELLYLRMVWAMCMPIIYLIIFLAIYLILVALKKLPYRVSIIYTALIYMFLYLHPTLIGGYLILYLIFLDL